MPMYDYRCKYCGYEKEIITRIAEMDDQVCPECEQRMERLVSSPGLLCTNFHDRPAIRRFDAFTNEPIKGRKGKI